MSYFPLGFLNFFDPGVKFFLQFNIVLLNVVADFLNHAAKTAIVGIVLFV